MLHENGQVEPKDLEAHLKNDIEREDVKIAEMQRKMRQTFYEVVSRKIIRRVNTDSLSLYLHTCLIKATAPVIQDDMMFADDGEMLLECVFLFFIYSLGF